MRQYIPRQGQRVRLLQDWDDVPAGSEGVIQLAFSNYLSIPGTSADVSIQFDAPKVRMGVSPEQLNQWRKWFEEI